MTVKRSNMFKVIFIFKKHFVVWNERNIFKKSLWPKILQKLKVMKKETLRIQTLKTKAFKNNKKS